ncbi:MAG TPA: rod shape-determining protein [Candidatus Eremiobacteraeota bacterium]|mgnify:CR=1 FL=1|nr:rod shape-determining protein [Candidatus Eremiobacteraeota bacterium]
MNLSFINDIVDFFSNNIAIDLGTANTPIYIKGKGIKLCEPTYIAIDRQEEKILAIGYEAKHMEGRVPPHIDIIRPLKEGVICDFEATTEMLSLILRRLDRKNSLIGPKVIIGLPSRSSPVEEKAVIEALSQSGAREVYTLEQPLAAAIGSGLHVLDPTGNMIIDIGGGTTQIAVISMGGSIVNEKLKVAGDRLTEKIIDFMRQQYNIAIGNNTAEEIKIFLGSAYPQPDEMSMRVKGSDVITGLPKTVKIQEGEIREILSETLREMLDIIKIGIEKTPPDLMSDIQEHGIVLTGGSSLLKGIDKLIEETTGLTVRIPRDPISTVAIGLGELFLNYELFRQVMKEKKQIRYQI